MSEFFVHYYDPGFPNPPWPMQRRIGPFLTHEEAFNQAVSDAAHGMGLALGIWSTEDSKKLMETTSIVSQVDEYGNPSYISLSQEEVRDAMIKIKPRFKAADIATSAEVMRKELERSSMTDEDRLALLKTILPDAAADDLVALIDRTGK